MAEGTSVSGDTGSAQAGTGAAPPAAQGQGNSQASTQGATGSDTPGGQARQEPSIPPHRLREEADARRAAEARATQYEQRLAQQAQELADLRQRHEADAPTLNRLRQAFAPEPEPELIVDPLESKVSGLEERLKRSEEYQAKREREDATAQVQAHFDAATAKFPLPKVAVGTVIERIRAHQQQHRKRPTAGEVLGIVKGVHEELVEAHETYRKSRDVPPPVELADRVAPVLPNEPKFRTTKERATWMAQQGTRH